jgi:hypothetical protein
MSAAQYSQRATDFPWLAGQTTDERAQRVLIELAMEYEALARRQPRRRVKHFSPPSLSGCDYLKHGAPSARGHVVKGHVARPARNPAVDRTTASDPAPAFPVLVRWREPAPLRPQTAEVSGAGQ